MTTLAPAPTQVKIDIQRVAQSKAHEVDITKLEFGRQPTDHMFLSEFKQGQWHNPRIVPFGPLPLTPFTLALHYGQTVFEGMKAYRRADGTLCIFRIDKHIERINRSLERMCMATIDPALFYEAVVRFVQTEAEWVPRDPESALYLRPFVIATEERIRVKISEDYLFSIVASPVGPYYGKPLNVKVETYYVRAAEGGVGYAKCGGNYAAAFHPTREAQQEGFDQVIWTDSRYNRYIEESGTMNLLFVIGNTIVTPPLSTSILDGITRDSILTLADGLGYEVEERKISVDELELRLQDGSLREAFGTGTAAVVAPIATINVREQTYSLPVVNNPESCAATVRQALHDIRMGTAPDVHNWCTVFQA